MAKIQYENPSSYSLKEPIHMGIYAVNGSGKSSLAGRAAEGGLRTVLLDCGDAGAITLRKIEKNLKIVKIKSTSHYLDVMEDIVRHASQIDLVVPDTLTGLQSMAIREVKGKRGDMNQRKWGQVSSKLIEAIAETRNFPNDVIYLIQEKRKTHEDSEDDISPALTPSVKSYLSSCVDWVGHLYVGDDVGTRYLDFRITNFLEAKDRAGLFPKLIRNPSYLGIRRRIQTELGVTNG